MASLLHDLRFALRSLFKHRAFTAVVVGTLALGIGANTAIFSVVNAALLQPLPFADPDRLYLIWGDKPASGYPQLPLSYPNFADVRERARGFDAMGAWTSFADSRLSLTGNGEPEKVQYAVVTSNLFPLLGVAPARGRFFVEADDRRGGRRGIVVSHALWERRFPGLRAGEAATLTLDGGSYEVIGVLPADFRFVSFPRQPDVWLPLGLDPFRGREYARGAAALGVVARLAATTTPEAARQDLGRVAAELAREEPWFNTGWTLRLVSLREQVVGDVRPALFVMLGAVGLVLLIGCANVANLLLVRASARHREIAVRLALGASGGRLVRQLLTESVLLSLAGGAAGLFVAAWLVELPSVVLLGGADAFVPYRVAAENVSLDGAVLGFTLLLSLVTGIVFGLAPALRASRSSLHDALRAGTRGSPDTARTRMRSALVVAEVAIAVTLVVGAGLLLRSFARLQSVDPGFRPEGVVTVELGLPAYKYGTPERVAQFYAALLERVRAIPGVSRVGAIEQLPLTGPAQESDFRIIGMPAPTPEERPQAVYASLTPDYFDAMAVRVVRGRAFRPSDDAPAPRVAVINESLARRWWPNDNPIGKRVALSLEALRFDRPDAPPRLDFDGAAREVVGVVADVRQNGLADPARPAIYLPFAQRPVTELSLVVRSTGDPAGIVRGVRTELRALDPDLPVSNIAMLSSVVSASVRQPRQRTTLLSAFALVALVLASVGVYGVISYGVTERTQEIGVRVALGASGSDVVRLVVGGAAGLALAGIALGLVGAFALTRGLATLLYGVTTTDAPSFLAASATVLAMALLASWLPARRAARLDPIVALKVD